MAPAPRATAAAAASSLVLLNLLLSTADALLPSPLPTLCVSTALVGCYIDDLPPNRTFPVAPTIEPTDPFGMNQTLETCAYQCDTLGYTVAAIEIGHQCFCTTPAGVANASSRLRPLSECTTDPSANVCQGNPFQACGGPFRALAYNFSCTPFNPAPQPWQDPATPLDARVANLVSLLSSAPSFPSSLIAQLTQNGADVYAPALQLPRYLVSQECLSGFDSGPIYIAPPIVSLNYSSAFPQPAGMGCTFDPALVREVASSISDEARAGWAHYNRPSLTCMSPVLNVARAMNWGRNYESFGEDPSAVGALGSAYIRGLQEGVPGELNNASASGILKVFAVPKHLGVYSVECYNASGGPNEYPTCPVYRSFYDSILASDEIREFYLPGWEQVFALPARENAPAPQGLMCAYVAINGVPSCGHGDLLRGIVEGEWGMPGLVISDADAIAQMGDLPPPDSPPPGHNFTHTLLESAVTGLINGTTVSLEDDSDPNTSVYHLGLATALADGLVTLADLQAAVTRALLPRFRAGLYDPPETVAWNSIPASVIESDASHALARRAAADALVLLQNLGSPPLLPFASPAKGGPSTIAVVGPASNCTGCVTNRYTGEPRVTVTHFQGIQAAAASRGATAVWGGTGGDAAVAAVAAADVGVVVLTGEPEGESLDRERLGFPADQLAFLQQLATETTTPLVVVVVSGGNVDVSPALSVAGAVIAAYNGGMEAGNGLADVLWGVVCPSGALAATMHRASWQTASDFLNMSVRTGLGRTHRYLTDEAVQEHVLFPFASGLSYTQFEDVLVSVVPPALSVAQLQDGQSFTLTVNVTNRGGGGVTGSRAVVVFLSNAAYPTGGGAGGGIADWPRAWLPFDGIGKLHGIAPRATATATFQVTGRDVSRWVAASGEGGGGGLLDGAWAVQPGTYSVALRDDGRGGARGAPQGTLVVTA
jgi:beta-glucosidase-like glycosyl hydrolase